MVEITSKELTALEDILSAEQCLVAKFTECAQEATDAELKSKYEQIALRHQRHYDEIYSNLK